MALAFSKMHGLGNDFVILDSRAVSFTLTPERVKAIASRHRGVGCDQLIVLDKAKGDGDFSVRMYNSDGSDVGACGNAARCIAMLESQKTGKMDLLIETVSGPIRAKQDNTSGLISVDMGPARLKWNEIPLIREMGTLAIDFGNTGLLPAVAVSMGNPHAIFFMDDVDALDITGIGPLIENHPVFPDRANVEFAEILEEGKIRMRVWERGAGVTQACGSGACATLVAAVRRQLCGRKAEIILDGGSLFVEWLANNHVTISGPATHVFNGVLDDNFLGHV